MPSAIEEQLLVCRASHSPTWVGSHLYINGGQFARQIHHVFPISEHQDLFPVVALYEDQTCVKRHRGATSRLAGLTYPNLGW